MRPARRFRSRLGASAPPSTSTASAPRSIPRGCTSSPRSSWRPSIAWSAPTMADPIDAVGGPTIGADPVVGHVAGLSWTRSQAAGPPATSGAAAGDHARVPLRAFLVRKDSKDHGTRRYHRERHTERVTRRRLRGRRHHRRLDPRGHSARWRRPAWRSPPSSPSSTASRAAPRR